MSTDPVCGMNVDEASAPARSEYQGRTYYFCSESCKDEFDKDPQSFAENVEGPETYA
jgi:YHS domain-containing protein